MREFYHSTDVQDAEWLIQTNEKFNHNVQTMLWAWRVIKWYMDLYEHVRSQVSRLRMSVRAALDNTLRLVKCGVLRFGIG